MSILSKVSRGASRTPLRVIVYGPEGVGKTTFACGAPLSVYPPPPMLAPVLPLVTVLLLLPLTVFGATTMIGGTDTTP